MIYLACASGPLSMAQSQAVHEDEHYPEYFVYAQQGGDTLKTLSMEAPAPS